MAFLGGSVSVFALRWAVGFLGNISRSRDMGFNARVTATVMLTGIGSWHLAPVTWPGPARPAYLCGGIWWKACCLIRPSWSIYRVCGKYAGAQVYYIHPRSSSVDGTYCSFWQPCSPPIPVWPRISYPHRTVCRPGPGRCGAARHFNCCTWAGFGLQRCTVPHNYELRFMPETDRHRGKKVKTTQRYDGNYHESRRCPRIWTAVTN